MKSLRILLVLVILSSSSFAQKVQVTSLEVDKGFPSNESNQSFNFKMAVLTDVSNFSLSLDEGKTKFTKIIDDKGFDLLKAQRDFEQKNNKKGYQVRELRIEYNSPVNSYETPGIIVSSRMAIIPSTGSKSVKIEGVVAMINIASGEKTYTVKNIPTAENWNSPGIDTEFGSITIQGGGSSSIDGIRYNIYRVVSKLPIAKINVIGGDDSLEAKSKAGMGVGGDEFIFKTAPETVDLEITVSNSETVEIPFSLEVSIGF